MGEGSAQPPSAQPHHLAIAQLRQAYRLGSTTPGEVIAHVLRSLPRDATFVSLTGESAMLQRCRELQEQPESQRGQLWGVPFAVKDNIDVAGHPTSAGCRKFTYQPQRSAAVVQALLDAGGIMVGKTNMDQFAAGLVGTRSPFGTPGNTFDSRFIPGGSSSGSAPAVAAGAVSFALGTDTAGSGRIPAGLNGCVGVKPTVGRVSSLGLVPAAASLDCITCFARCVDDAALVVRLMQDAGPKLLDPSWRPPDPAESGRQWQGGAFTFAVPSEQHLDFSGPGGVPTKQVYESLFGDATAQLTALGGQQVSINWEPFAATARALYESSFVAERYAGIRAFIEADRRKPPHAGDILQDERFEKVIAAILSGAVGFSAADVYRDNQQLRELKAQARAQLEAVDCLLVPTALHHYTVREIEKEEKQAEKVTWRKNANLGRFTNFVNLLDLCAASVPSGVYRHPRLDPASLHGEALERAEQLLESGDAQPVLPFGVTLIAKAWRDEWLWSLAARYHAQAGVGCGAQEHGRALGTGRHTSGGAPANQ